MWELWFYIRIDQVCFLAGDHNKQGQFGSVRSSCYCPVFLCLPQIALSVRQPTDWRERPSTLICNESRQLSPWFRQTYFNSFLVFDVIVLFVVTSSVSTLYVRYFLSVLLKTNSVQLTSNAPAFLVLFAYCLQSFSDFLCLFNPHRKRRLCAMPLSCLSLCLLPEMLMMAGAYCVGLSGCTCLLVFSSSH